MRWNSVVGLLSSVCASSRASRSAREQMRAREASAREAFELSSCRRLPRLSLLLSPSLGRRRELATLRASSAPSTRSDRRQGASRRASRGEAARTSRPPLPRPLHGLALAPRTRRSRTYRARTFRRRSPCARRRPARDRPSNLRERKPKRVQSRRSSLSWLQCLSRTSP